MEITSITGTVKPADHVDPEYDAFLARVQARFDANLAKFGGRLFTTDVEYLFDRYLAGFPLATRQHCNCHACSAFVGKYGGLVVVDDKGNARSAIWDTEDAPGSYRTAVGHMAAMVHAARVTGVFLDSEEVWGRPVTGPWHHFAVTPPSHVVHRSLLLTAGQKMAELRQDFEGVVRALQDKDLRPDVLDQALSLIQREAVTRSEKVEGPVRWLRELHTARDAARGRNRENLVWRAVAEAPPGYAHIRNSVGATLLADLAGGMAVDYALGRFVEKMDPLQYRRPQAAPSAGNIAAAEAMVAKLGISASLKRRFARLDEIATIWRPNPPVVAETGGVFGHLKPKGAEPVAGIALPPITMTWEKFARVVLPKAEAIEYHLLHTRDNFLTFTTAVDPAAPPILQWDREERRNPVSMYGYSTGAVPAQFGLTRGLFQWVTGISTNPAHWGGNIVGSTHHVELIALLLEDAVDSGDGGLALFPEVLKSELNAVRSTIEAFSKAGKLEGREAASASGIAIVKGGSYNVNLRVTSGGVVQVYKIDRWD